jgi:raffinose/stachyose/melibiose transport system substrate-binding protein
MTISRRNFLGLGVGAGAAAALAACGSSGPSGSGSSGGGAAGSATYWSLSGEPGEPIRQAAVKRFNDANPSSKITPTFFANDAYKQIVMTSVGRARADDDFK